MYRNGNSCAYLGHRCHCLVRSASLSFATGAGRLSPRWGVPLILIGASPAPIAGSGAASVIIRWMVTFDPVRGLRHIAKMVAAVMKIEAGSLWAVARIEGVEAPDTWS